MKSLVLSRYSHSDPPSRLNEDDLTGKTSNRAVENNSESEQRTVPPQRRNLIPPNFGERIHQLETIDLRTLEFGPD